MRRTSLALVFALALPAAAAAEQDADALAKQLSNPVASLISVPFQYNIDFGYEPDGTSHLLNIQPVIPIKLSEDWNLISRTILPLRYQDDIFATDVSGTGDVLQSLFFSPSQPTSSGIIWGVGPVINIPTASDQRLGSQTWGLGLTAVVLKQSGKWTVGMLANHVWSIGQDEGRPDISNTFLQPFVTYSLGKGQTVTFNTEASYDWTGEQWTVPLNLSYSKVFSAGDQLMSFLVGGRVYAESPHDGPDWGLRTGLTLLFPAG